MMVKTLFFTLFALCLFLLAQGLRRKEGIFQFPVLFTGAFAFSVIPQLVNYVFYPIRLPEQVYLDHGPELGILMCILCLVAGVLGYQHEVRGEPKLGTFLLVVRPGAMFWAGVVLCLIGLYGALRLSELAGGFRARFTEGGHYALEWTGRSVLYSYVSRLLTFGLILCLVSALIRGSLLKWFFTGLMMLYPLAQIVFLGRRSVAVTMALVVVLSLWYRKRWAPPRIVSLLMLMLGGLLIIYAPYYRRHANETGDVRAALEQIDPEEVWLNYATGERGEGMDNLIVGVPARLKYPSYGLGSGFWDAVVDYLVPAQFVGRDFKDGLFFQLPTKDEDLFPNYCGYFPATDSFSTGPYSAFIEFSFLGCLLYYFIARFYRQLWHLASERQVVSAQVLYLATALLGPLSVVNSVPGVFSQFVLVTGVLGPTLWLIGSRNPAPRKPVQGEKRSRLPLKEGDPVPLNTQA